MIKPHCLGPDHEGELAFVAPGRPGGAERGCLGECSGWVPAHDGRSLAATAETWRLMK